MFNVWSIHHDQRYWKNPMKFDPQRYYNYFDRKLCRKYMNSLHRWCNG